LTPPNRGQISDPTQAALSGSHRNAPSFAGDNYFQQIDDFFHSSRRKIAGIFRDAIASLSPQSRSSRLFQTLQLDTQTSPNTVDFFEHCVSGRLTDRAPAVAARLLIEKPEKRDDRYLSQRTAGCSLGAEEAA
jgi:hypothetical protein